VLAAVPVLIPLAANAQMENITPPSGAMAWHYECKARTKCPTSCRAKGNELFQTADYRSITILQMPNQGFWIRVDTRQANIDYVGAQVDQVICSIAGATLIFARAQESGK
jgi:hypothetical protein